MLRTRAQVLALLLILGVAVGGEVQAAEPDTVLVRSGDLELRALLWRPQGRGPFPAILFNHGSGHATGADASGRPDQRHPELLGPVFTLGFQGLADRMVDDFVRVADRGE